MKFSLLEDSGAANGCQWTMIAVSNFSNRFSNVTKKLGSYLSFLRPVGPENFFVV